MAPVNKALLAIVIVAFGMTDLSPARAQSTGAQIPTLGDTSDMSSSNERRLGDRIAREIYRDPDYLDDPVLAEYVQGVWQPLLAAARARGDLSPELAERFAWEVMLGRDRTVNAFALPGGYLGVHLGLIAVVSNRDELASVLGHELSHVTQRHISRLMAKQGQMAPWMIGAMVLGALAAGKSADAGNALIVGGQAVAAQNQLNFSRDMEREADRVGFGIMTEAGFKGQGFVTMFDKLQQASRLTDNGAYPYLRSHPLTTERIADMQARQGLAAPGPVKATLTLEHALVAARARVLSNADVDALRTWQAEAGSAGLSTQAAPRQAGVWYGAALAASQLRDFAQARIDLEHLRGLVTGDASATRLARLLQAEIALRAGDAAGAQTALNTILTAAAAPGAVTAQDQASTTRRPELLLAAQIALQAGPAGQTDPAGGSATIAAVAVRLQTWVTVHPHDAQAWQLLSSLQGAQHQTLRALRADAEAQVARLDYAAAVDRFKAAQAFSHQQHSGQGQANGGASPSQAAADHIDESIIDTRQRQVQSLLKEQTLDR
ncbi:peptidase M48, Ste24p [Rhodoferax ferrireducens T118]|uniref:Peptidase M48, Ste24p n=1 Tax=Albidiferax ferrireducens (strain ATCC BAA-621 / DSM 15236 / T118) TaxID=338969 RepID=Q21R64_ALBFT|nr:peptidase M48, Ste24p [Rhodoferax ferrireducens T118]